MNTLPGVLNLVVTTLQLWSRTQDVHSITTEQFSATQFAIKVRAYLKSSDVLQVRLYCNESHIDYAYQLIRMGTPLVRWDNKEHFPTLATYPHHFHSLSGQVLASDLTGLPDADLPTVLREIEILFLKFKAKQAAAHPFVALEEQWTAPT